MKKEILGMIYKYIFLLIIAAVLCTGTVFARYSSSNSLSSGANVGNFNYTFTVDEVSATSFNNISFYADDGSKNKSASLKHITFTLNENDSEVAATSTFRFSADYDFLSNLAFQFVEVAEDGTETAISPQYIMSEFLSGNGDTSTYARTYDEIGSPADQSLSVTTGTNSFTATGANSNGDITISLSTEDADHNVTYIYNRGKIITITTFDGVNFTYEEVNDLSAPEIYVECGETSGYSTLEINLPELNMEPSGGNASRTYKFYFTTINKTDITTTYDSTLLDECESYYYNVESVNAYDNSSCTGTASKINVTVKVNNDTATTAYYNASSGGGEELVQIGGGASTIYGDEASGVYIDISGGYFGLDYNYLETTAYSTVEEATGVVFPMTLNIIFAQSEQC